MRLGYFKYLQVADPTYSSPNQVYVLNDSTFPKLIVLFLRFICLFLLLISYIVYNYFVP